jgi:hypothetical protein
MTYRLWCEGEDYGTAGERQAQMWLTQQRAQYADEEAHIEPVADDAPVFLPAAPRIVG